MSTADGIQGIFTGLGLILGTGTVAFLIAWATSWRTQNYLVVFQGTWFALNLVLLFVVLALGGALR